MPIRNSNNQLSVLSNKEILESKSASRRTYGFRFYGGSTLYRSSTQEKLPGKSSSYLYQLNRLSATSASKASFNRKATILPDIKSTKSLKNENDKQVVEILKEKKSEKAEPVPIQTPTPDEQKTGGGNSSPFSAALLIKKLIRNRRSTMTEEQNPKVDEEEKEKIAEVPEDKKLLDMPTSIKEGAINQEPSTAITSNASR